MSAVDRLRVLNNLVFNVKYLGELLRVKRHVKRLRNPNPEFSALACSLCHTAAIPDLILSHIQYQI